jgi:hypothetical protein
MNRKKRNEKFNELVSQITNLLSNNQNNLTYLADGSEYKLSFTIKCDEKGISNIEPHYYYIKKV